MGLGSHDLSIATHTAALYQRGLFPRIVFTGANAPTTIAAFPRGEAVHYREHALSLGVPDSAILIEPAARNTGENITRTRDLLTAHGITARSVRLISRPYQQRRAYATCRRLWPDVDVRCASLPISLDDHLASIGDAGRVRLSPDHLRRRTSRPDRAGLPQGPAAGWAQAPTSTPWAWDRVRPQPNSTPVTASSGTGGRGVFLLKSPGTDSSTPPGRAIVRVVYKALSEAWVAGLPEGPVSVGYFLASRDGGGADMSEQDQRTSSWRDGRSTEIDMTQPSIARVYDAVLGGKDNFEVDRAIAEESLRIIPEIGDVARYNREILRRGVTFLAREAGIRQFLDLGSGLPTVENTHQIAQRCAPEAQVIYVDKDPIVLAYGRALLAENDRTAVITADLRTPDAITAHPVVNQLLDFSKPICLMLIGVIHHLGDDENPNGIISAYIDALPSGSYLFLTHFCASSPDALVLEDALLRDLGTGRFRSLEEIEAYFTGLELLDPGVVYLPMWRPTEPPTHPLTVGQRLMAGGLARKP